METKGKQKSGNKLVKVNNGKGGFYRYTQEEVRQMKQLIMLYFENAKDPDPNGKVSSYQLRCNLSMYAFSPRFSKKRRAKSLRELALYDSLTEKFLPNWE